MDHLWGIVVGDFVAFLTAYFGCIQENLSLSCKRNFPCVVSNIPIALSRTYAVHPNVPPMLNSARDLKVVVVEK